MIKKLVIAIVIVVAIVALIGMWFVKTKNRLVQAEEDVNEGWAQVENVYQRRADLIPNLVATVKGYAAHERETLQAVVEARSRVGQVSGEAVANAVNSPEALQRFQEAQGALSSALSRLMVVVERYPELKANENFLSLQAQLEGSENRIAVERRRYNEVARSYNVMIRQFPTSIVAERYGFERKAFFEAQEGAEQAPKVEF